MINRIPIGDQITALASALGLDPSSALAYAKACPDVPVTPKAGSPFRRSRRSVGSISPTCLTRRKDTAAPCSSS